MARGSTSIAELAVRCGRRGLRWLAPSLLAIALAVPSARAVTYQFDTPIAGDRVPVTLTLRDVAAGVEVALSIPPGAGDLLGLFGSVDPDSPLPTLGVSNPTGVVTQWHFAANAVSKVGSANMTTPVNGWDWGVALEQQGSAGGAVESARFVLTGVTSTQLSAAANQGWVFGVRIQSTTGPDGSAKVGMPEGTPPLVQPPTIAIESPTEGELVPAAFRVSGTVTGEAVSVSVNGVAAAVTAEEWSASLSLTDGTHTLAATATNSAGSASDAIQVHVDATGPEITITAPAPAALTSQTPIAVSGLVADASAVTAVTIDGTSFPVVSGTFSGTAGLSEGANTIAVSALDAQGNAGSASVAVTLDSIPPRVTIDTPPGDSLTVLSLLNVAGAVSDASAIRAFTVNETPVPLEGGAYSTALAIPLGSSEITASATDAAGNTGSAMVTVTRGELPRISIASPAPGLLTREERVDVSGTAEGATAVSVNGVSVALSEGAWSATLSLAEGTNTLTATATNAFGSAQARVGVTRDSLPPVVTITSPADGAEFTAAEIHVAGVVEDASPILALSLNETELPATHGFDAPVVLADGSNSLTVVATDLAGNVGSASIAVALTSGALRVTIASPAEGSLVTRDPIAVGGTVTDPNALVEVNGVNATVTGSSWIAVGVPVEEGDNTLSATASRAAQIATDEAHVVFRRAPEITITSPIDASVVRGETIDVEGLVSSAAVFVDVNGVAAKVEAGGRFTAAAVPLAPGESTLVARAVDLEAAQATDEARVIRDDGASPKLKLIVVSEYNFAAYPEETFSDPPAQTVGFSSLEEWQAAMAAIGPPANSFSPPPAQPPVWWVSPLLVVLTEQPDEPTIEAIRPDGTPAPQLFVQRQVTGPIEQLDSVVSTWFDAVPVNRAVWPASDFEPRYFHVFGVSMSLASDGVDEEGNSFRIPGSTPLSFVATQGAASAAVPVFWDEENVEAEISSPGDSSVIAGPSTIVTGSARDNHSMSVVTYRIYNYPGGFAEIELGSGAAPVVDGRFILTDVPLAAGGHNLWVTPKDATSVSRRLVRQIDHDPGAADVSMIGPLNGQALVEDSTPLAFNFGTPLTLVSVNGVPDGRSFTAGAHFDVATIPLALGPNPIELVVDVGAGLEYLAFSLYRVDALSGVRISSPTTGEWVNQSTLTVEGTVPLGTPYVEVNGVPARIEPNGLRWKAQIPVPQTDTILGETEPRPYRITAVAYPQGDAESIDVKPDLIAPSFGSVLPQSGAATVVNKVVYGGWVSEIASVTLAGIGFGSAVQTTESHLLRSLGGGSVWPVRVHRFDFEALALADGVNPVTLTARDRAGNETAVQVAIEKVAPALTLVSPTPGSRVLDLAADLVFSVSGEVVIDALFSNGAYIPSASGVGLALGTQVLAGIPLAPGGNELRVVYRRPGGSQQSLSLELGCDATQAAVVEGVVSDSHTGRPVGGALVSLTADGRTIVVTTDAAGRYRGVVAPGAVVGSAIAVAYAGSTFQVSVAGGGTATADTSLAYTGVDSLGNELRILVPPEGTITDWERITVVGSVLRGDSSVTVNGIPAEVIGNRFSARGIALSPGANTLTVRAEAVGAPALTLTRELERSDQPVLDVEIYSPPSGAASPGNGLVVRGWVSARDAIARANGAYGIPHEGVFAAMDVLVHGEGSRIAIRAERPNGEAADVSSAVWLASPMRALDLAVGPTTGEAPLAVRLTLGSRVPLSVGRLDFDFDSDGVLDRVAALSPDVGHEYATPASPEARAFLTTSNGVELTAGARVRAYLPHAAGATFGIGNPVDLAEAPQGDVFVLDRAAGILRRYRANGALVGEIGAGAGLHLPEAVDADASGRIAVVDTGNARVVLLDALGGVLATFGSAGAGEDQLSSPRGIGLGRDLVAVADAGNDRVQVYRLTGEHIGSAPLANPRAIAALGPATFLVASPSAGLRVLDVRGDELRVSSAMLTALNGPADLPGAPVEVASGPSGLLMVDQAGPRVLLYGERNRIARVLDRSLPGRPLALLGSHRRDTPAFYLADGERVHEVLLPVPSPLPVALTLRDRMRSGDATGILELIHPFQRPLFDRMQQALGSNLPAYGSAIGSLRVDLLREEEAIVRAEFTDASGITLQLPISLDRRSDGGWSVSNF